MVIPKKSFLEDADLPETAVQTFIIKIWVEESASESSDAVWRGHITKVMGGQRRYVKNLDEITSYFRAYIAKITGVNE